MEFQAATFQIFQHLNLNICNKKSQLHLFQSRLWHIVACFEKQSFSEKLCFMFLEGSKVHVPNFLEDSVWKYIFHMMVRVNISISVKKKYACCLIYYYFQLWCVQLHIQSNFSLPSCPSQFYLPASLRKEGRKQQGARALFAAHYQPCKSLFYWQTSALHCLKCSATYRCPQCVCYFANVHFYIIYSIAWALTARIVAAKPGQHNLW